MKNKRTLTIVAISIMVILVMIDQIVKIWVKTNMELGDSIPLIGNWCLLHFVENPGMAFGLSFGENLGKLLLSLFRIVVVGWLLFYMFRRIYKGTLRPVAVILLSIVLAGAIGNIIDSAFYGMIFHYAPFMYGSVVDMFYFPLFIIPQGVPIFGGEYFFPAVFNVADSCVTVGLIAILFCMKSFVEVPKKEENKLEQTTAVEEITSEVSK